MASSFTYPGIYIQEVPSTVHTFVPAPTAVTAFVGRALRGPINTPIRIHSYADFERAFGGLWSQSEMPYCVQEYFLNGGSDGYVVRAVTQAIVSAQNTTPASVAIPSSLGPLNINAQNPGSWFKNVIISIDWNTRKINGARKPDEFNLTMTYNEIDPVTGAAAVTVEKFVNVSYLAGAANYIVTTLTNDSYFIDASAPPQAKPNPGSYSLNGMVWAPGFAFTAGTILIDLNGNAQQVTTAGTSGKSTPKWSTVVGGTTSDGTVTWTTVASIVPAAWQPLTSYTSGQTVFDGVGLQRLTTPASGTGTSGSVTPLWNSSTPDAALVWTNAGPTGVWKAATRVSAGAAFYDVANNLQVVTTAGVTGSPAQPAWNAAAGGTTPDGSATWTNLGAKATITAEVWTANKAYSAGTVLFDPDGNAQVVTTAGTSGAAAPTFNEMLGGTTPEGPDTLIWTNMAASMNANWKATATFTSGQLICDGTDLQRLTTPGSGTGTSGAATPAWNSTTSDGALIWTNAGATGSWQASTVYSLGASIMVAGNLQTVTTVTPPGKSSAVQPAFNTTPGQTTTDNNLTWTNLGAAPSGGSWKPNTFFSAGDQIYDVNGGIEVVQTAGVSGGSPPTWTLPTIATPNPNTNDGTVVWQLQSMSGLSDGQPLTQADLTSPSLEAAKEGIYALKDAEIFTLMVLPPYGPQENGGTVDLDLSYAGIWADALAFCQIERAVLLVDPPSPATWIDEVHAYLDVSSATPAIDNIRDANSAMYYPWLEIADPLLSNRPRDFAPSASVAGVMARIDGKRGVWKSPAGEEAKLLGVASLQYLLNDAQNGDLNPLGINCLRTFPIIGSVVWGARTLDGADAQASQWKYVAVRRMALFIEDSLYAGTGWALFEPNDEPLWSELRLNVGSFMRNLFRQGAFQGQTPKQAYFVKCDSDTTTQTDIDNGVVNILVGFAPLKPAEFIVIKISQITGDASAS